MTYDDDELDGTTGILCTVACAGSWRPHGISATVTPGGGH
jgi:hypothetical protein